MGAGIAGLSLAHELRLQGIADVTVLERTTVFEHVGGGIHLGPWGMQVLEANGIADAVRTLGVPFTVRKYFDGAGDLLGTVDLGGLAARFGGPLGVYCHRADLHAALADAVGPGVVHLGVHVTSIAGDSEGVRVDTASHGAFEADLLVGCDGLHSQVRERMTGTGGIPLSKRALRTVVQAPDPDMDVEVYRGIGSTVGLGRIDRRGAMYVWTHTPSGLLGPTHEATDPRDELRGLLATYAAPRMRQLEELVAEASVVATDLQEVIVPTLWRHRMVLAGDAAHAMSPSAGLGGSMAFEDAAVLARQLGRAHAGNASLSEALDRYARQRLPRVEAVRSQARYTDYDGQLTSPELCRIRDERFARLLAKPDAFAAEVTDVLDLVSS